MIKHPEGKPPPASHMWLSGCPFCPPLVHRAPASTETPLMQLLYVRNSEETFSEKWIYFNVALKLISLANFQLWLLLFTFVITNLSHLCLWSTRKSTRSAALTPDGWFTARLSRLWHLFLFITSTSQSPRQPISHWTWCITRNDCRGSSCTHICWPVHPPGHLRNDKHTELLLYPAKYKGVTHTGSKGLICPAERMQSAAPDSSTVWVREVKRSVIFKKKVC